MMTQSTMAIAIFVAILTGRRPTKHTFRLSSCARTVMTSRRTSTLSVLTLRCIARRSAAANSAGFVLEDTDKPVRDFEEISLTDPRAVSLIGKRVGDTFVLAAAPMGNREAIIRKIQTKYVRRFQDCMTELQVRFGP